MKTLFLTLALITISSETRAAELEGSMAVRAEVQEVTTDELRRCDHATFRTAEGQIQQGFESEATIVARAEATYAACAAKAERRMERFDRGVANAANTAMETDGTHSGYAIFEKLDAND